MHRRFVVVLFAISCTSCATAPEAARSALLDPLKPFGLEWTVSEELRLQYLENQREECEEYYADVPEDGRDADVQFCLDDPVSFVESESSSLPEPLEQGYFRTVLDGQSGEVTEYAHIFNLWFASFPSSDDAEIARQQSVFETEYAIWQTVTRETLGAPDSVGSWDFFSGYSRIDEGEANCEAWIREPSAIILCKDRLFSPDAGEASISMFNLEAAGVDELRKDILGDQ